MGQESRTAYRARREHLARPRPIGRDPQMGTSKYHNQTIHSPFREAQRFLNLKLQQRDNSRVSRDLCFAQ
jgi:hypothetical protein